MSYYTEVSSSNPQVWWRMNVSASVVANSGDPGFSVASGTFSTPSTANRIESGTAVYSNPYYFPHADMSSALFQNYYGGGGSGYIGSSNSMLTGVFDMFVTGGSGFTAEWLMKFSYGGNYSNNAGIWGWVNTAGAGGMTFRMSSFPDAGTYYLKTWWLNAANSTQSLEVGWGAGGPNQGWQQAPKYGYETYANQGIWGTWGPHNGWHHFVVTATPVTIGGGGAPGYVLWIDGLRFEIDYAAGTNPPPSGAHTTFTDQKLYIGNVPAITYFYHMLSEVAFYSRTLPDAEIINHWAALARWNSNISATLLDPTGSASLLYSVQAPAGNINYVPAASGTGNDPRATKTNPGAN